MKEGLLKYDDTVNIDNSQGDTLLHSLVKLKFEKRKGRLKRDLLAALLTYSDADVNRHNGDGLTALHLAVQVTQLCC